MKKRLLREMALSVCGIVFCSQIGVMRVSAAPETEGAEEQMETPSETQSEAEVSVEEAENYAWDAEEEDISCIKVPLEEWIPPTDLKWEAPGRYSFKYATTAELFYYLRIRCDTKSNGMLIGRGKDWENIKVGDTVTGECLNYFDRTGTYTLSAYVNDGYDTDREVVSPETAEIYWVCPDERVATPTNLHWESPDKDHYAVIVCDPVEHAYQYIFQLYIDGKPGTGRTVNENRVNMSFYMKEPELHEYQVRVWVYSDDLMNYANSEVSELSPVFKKSNEGENDNPPDDNPPDSKFSWDSYPRLIIEDNGRQRVCKKGVELARYTGLAILGAEGKTPWVYAEDSKLNTEYTGYVDYEGAKFYVENGYVKTDLNGVMIDPNSEPDYVWYYNANGQVQMQHTGLAEYDGEWFYIKKGKVATEMNAFVEYDGGIFAVGAGRIISEHSGLMQDPEDPVTGDWYFFAEGQAQTQYTGLAQYDGEWFYVVKGKLAVDHTGTVDYDGATFNVENGMVK